MDEKKMYPEDWSKRIQPFADGVGKTPEEITNILALITGEPVDDKATAEALEVLSNKEAVSDADLVEAFKSLLIPSGKLKLNLSKLRGEPKVEPAATTTGSTALSALAILPAVPDENSFLDMLKTGGVLKVETTEVISAVKAAFAKKVGLYELPEKILKKMEAYAIAQDEPCGEAFYKMQKLLTQKKYGDILSVLGVDGNYVSETRKKDFFQRLDSRLWASLGNFQTQLKQWQDTWLQGLGNSGAVMVVMAGRNGGSLPAGLMDAPDTTPLRAAAEEVVNDVNRIFAGPGIPVARALAYDATRIMSILGDSQLPPQTGAATKEQMLKDLGVNVGADIVRTEQSITRFTLAVMSLQKVSADAEVEYLSAMNQLGNSINWKAIGIGIGTMAGIGSEA